MLDDFRIYIQIHLGVTLKAIKVSYAFKLNEQKRRKSLQYGLLRAERIIKCGRQHRGNHIIRNTIETKINFLTAKHTHTHNT